MAEKKGLFSFLNFDSIVENFSGYLEKRIALFKIELMDNLALASARVVIWVVLSLCIFMIILFLSIASAFFLNKLLDSGSLGFIIVAGFYLLIFIILSFVRNKKIEERLKNIFLEMFNNLDENDGQD